MDTWHQKVTRTHIAHTITWSEKSCCQKSWTVIAYWLFDCRMWRNTHSRWEDTIHTVLGRLSIGSHINSEMYYSGILICPQTAMFLLRQAIVIMCWPTLFHVSLDDVTEQNVRISGGLNPRADQLSTTSLSDQDRIQASTLNTHRHKHDGPTTCSSCVLHTAVYLCIKVGQRGLSSSLLLSLSVRVFLLDWLSIMSQSHTTKLKVADSRQSCIGA